jgi:pyridoxamine 5'-phosphate oxidase
MKSGSDTAQERLQALRQEYGDLGIDPATAPASPFDAFREWFDQAVDAGLHEPNAMTLATVSAHGIPEARVVLLKGADDQGFVFYTNYESSKGRELAQNPRCALVFNWAPIERQVRVVGVAEKVSRDETEAYFRQRPRTSQLGAWASRQSDVLASREPLEQRMRELTAEYEGKDVPVPPFWGGYRVVPSVIELWQGRRSRLHDRVRYTREGAGFRRERLSP